MIMTLEHIKKLMGWCPNAKASEIRSWDNPANFEIYDQSGGEKARYPKISSQYSKLFSRLDVRLLLPALFLTPFYLILLFLKGVNTEAFFLSIFLFLLIYSLCWKKLMQQYDAIAKKPIFSSFSKIVLLLVSLSLIWFLIFPIRVFLSYTPSSNNSQPLYSFIAGIWILTMWGISLQLIYWERKNRMKICIKNENGFQKMYALREKKGEL